MLHTLLDVAYAHANLVALVNLLATLHERHGVLSLLYQAETFLNLVEGSHHIIDFIVFLLNNLLKGIDTSIGLAEIACLFILTCYYRQGSKHT